MKTGPRNGEYASMRHKVAGFKLKRRRERRNALLRNLVTSVILEERVITTVPKAKAAKPLVEKMITLGKQGRAVARPPAGRPFLLTPASVQKLFDTMGTRFANAMAAIPASRGSARKGDGAEQAMIELVGSELVAARRIAPSAAKRSSKPCRKAAKAAVRQSPNLYLPPATQEGAIPS